MVPGLQLMSDAANTMMLVRHQGPADSYRQGAGLPSLKISTNTGGDSPVFIVQMDSPADTLLATLSCSFKAVRRGPALDRSGHFGCVRSSLLQRLSMFPCRRPLELTHSMQAIGNLASAHESIQHQVLLTLPAVPQG